MLVFPLLLTKLTGISNDEKVTHFVLIPAPFLAHVEGSSLQFYQNGALLVPSRCLADLGQSDGHIFEYIVLSKAYFFNIDV